MKRNLLIGILALLAWACSPPKEAAKTRAVLARNGQDSSQYEILIIDTHFDRWYLDHYSPAKDRSNDYYRSRNQVAAANWDQYFREGRYAGVVDCLLNYQPGIDYGIEVNRKLFWYFTYVEEKYRIRLLL